MGFGSSEQRGSASETTVPAAPEPQNGAPAEFMSRMRLLSMMSRNVSGSGPARLALLRSTSDVSVSMSAHAGGSRPENDVPSK